MKDFDQQKLIIADCVILTFHQDETWEKIQEIVSDFRTALDGQAHPKPVPIKIFSVLVDLTKPPVATV